MDRSMDVRTGRKKKGSYSWRAEEDELLRRLVAEHGPHRWSVISGGIPGRSGKSCRLRWCNQLSPGVQHRAFSPQEEAVLAAAHARHGNKWATIARLLPGRTDNSVKNHWNSNLRKTLRRQAKFNFKSESNNNYKPRPLQLQRPDPKYIVLDDDDEPPVPVVVPPPAIQDGQGHETSLSLSLSLSLPGPAAADLQVAPAIAIGGAVDDKRRLMVVMRQMVREEVQRHTAQLAYSLIAMATCWTPPSAPN